jgi:hypothetical protein
LSLQEYRSMKPAETPSSLYRYKHQEEQNPG